ncbi:MAG: hypothetical protein ABI411_06745 [Tahibacter sp.]
MPRLSITNSVSYVRCDAAQKDADAVWFVEIHDPAFAARIALHELGWDANGGVLWVHRGIEPSALAAARVALLHLAERRNYLQESRQRFANLRPEWFPIDAGSQQRMLGWYAGRLLFDGGGGGHYYWISSRL